MPLTKDLYMEWARRMEENDNNFFLWSWELVIITYNVWNKTPESIYQIIIRGQWGTQ